METENIPWIPIAFGHDALSNEQSIVANAMMNVAHQINVLTRTIDKHAPRLTETAAGIERTLEEMVVCAIRMSR